MKHISPGVFLAAAIAALAGHTVIAADRLTDSDVKALVARIDEGRGHFEDALDDKLKHNILKGPSGEVDVERVLDDFQRNIDLLDDRMKPGYAASNEVATLLRQSSSIDRFFRQQPPGTKGGSEWNRLATDLKALAAAYGTEFPLPDNASVRRMGDGELTAALGEFAHGADDLKKSLDADLRKDVDQLAKDAKALGNLIKNGKPSSGEAGALLARATRMQGVLNSRPVPASVSIWNDMTPRLQLVATAYGISWPSSLTL